MSNVSADPKPLKSGAAVCARCGHQAGHCPRCGRRDPFLGGYADGQRLCHTFSDQPSCYTLHLREQRHPRPEAGS
jgi:hypothetical protein